MITLQVENSVLEAGQSVSGRWSWQGTEQPKAIHLKLSWRTEGRGTVDDSVVYANSYKGATSAAFTCVIPATGPVSYDGQVLRVIWEVIVEAELPGLFADKPKAVEVIRVRPRRAIFS